MSLDTFKKTIWDYYKKYGRHDLPWRKTKDPYRILVSEMMLQQTQVSRVIPKYKNFLKKFPTVEALAKAPLRQVLIQWQGLGYNRRALYLKKCAEKVVTDFDGKFPKDVKTLVSLPGIGPATAGDILAFAYNIPVPIIETNIRSVFIHFFFPNKKKISDKQILPLIGKTMGKGNPREWYWALFDYGAYLKTSGSGNPSRRSAHHTKQSPFKGSNRQIRARILRLILEKPRTEKEITKILGQTPSIVAKNLASFVREETIVKRKSRFQIR